MAEDKYVLMDNSNYLTYYLKNLKDIYVPIALREQTRAYLESRGIHCIGIFDYLDSSDLKDVTKKALAASDTLISEIDENNKQNYIEMFGVDGIRLFHVTVDYLFKRFVIAVFRMVKGLEGILANNKVLEIAYLHDSRPSIICGTLKQCGFFFPDDITWDILQNWQPGLKPALNLIKAPGRSTENKPFVKNNNYIFRNNIRTIKTFLSPAKRYLLSLGKHKRVIDRGKKNLLFLYPFYDFSSLLEHKSLANKFNLLTWHPEGKNESWGNNRIDKLNFSTEGFNNRDFADNLNVKELLVPLLERFYEKKMPDIEHYWNQAKGIQNANKIDMLLWGNSPHRYPAGIVKEFFRINRVPICGMQHGGLSGSNYLGKVLFETEFNRSDYYFSYGFSGGDIENERNCYGVNLSSRIIPVGSLYIDRFLKDFQKQSGSSRRKEVDVIFPIAVVNKEFFYDFEENNPRLFKLQKRIIDLLAGFNGKKIVLKFLVGDYLDNPLGIYIEHKYPNKFQIVDYVSFSEYLKKVKADTIIIERQSTPLNEAILTESNIVIYNNIDWCGLTAKAHQLLSKRAIVCDEEEVFFSRIRDCLEGRPEKRDIPNREFIEKYCIYKGSPEINIEREILLLISHGLNG